MKCWEHFKCGNRKCPVYGTSNLRCWMVTGTHCHNAVAVPHQLRSRMGGQLLPASGAELVRDEDKLLVCTRCKVFAKNVNEKDWKDMFNLVHGQFNQHRQKMEGKAAALEKTREQVNTMIRNLIDTMLLVDNLAGEIKFARPSAGAGGIPEPCDERITYGDLIGSSPQMRGIYSLIEKVGPTDSTVVIQGESGTGKELVARAIHQASNNRRNQRFVPVNCGALPETLLDSEMFGYERGAFTGANGRKYGHIELANMGTLFLDEIGDASPSLQLKLLRALQEKEIIRVGGTEPVKVDIRLVAATNKDLQREVSEGRVREDLYYRLNVITINTPPLRDRKEDISLLAHHFLKKFAMGNREGVKTISSDAMALLLRCNWPGNVRQLENVIERAVTLNSRNGVISLEDLPPDLRNGTGAQRLTSSYAPSLKELLSQTEKDYLIKLLDKTKGNVSRAAELANLDRTNLHKKLHKYKIDAANYR